MNLGEIISSALDILSRSHDANTIEEFRAQFTYSANNAMMQIARRFKQSRKETVALTNKTFSTSQLARQCIRIDNVYDSDGVISFNQDIPGSGSFVCDTTDSEVKVVYEFFPNDMLYLSDIPDVPAYTHNIIPLYIVACHRAGAGDGDTQVSASVYFSLFNARLRDLIHNSHRSEPNSYKLLNY